MGNFKFLFTALLLLLLTSGYSQYYYTPDNSSTLLLIHNKGDLKLSSTIPSYAQTNIEVAYSPINKLSLKLGWYKHSTTRDGIIPSTDGKTFSAAIGTYNFFERPNRRDDAKNTNAPSGILLDFYVGYTKATIDNIYASATSSHLNYQKLFAHLGLHYQSRLLSVGYVMKVSTLDYKDGTINGSPSSLEIFAINDEILVNDPYTLLETDMRVTIGSETLNGYVQISMINPNILSPSLLADRDLVFTAGIVLGVNKVWSLIKKH